MSCKNDTASPTDNAGPIEQNYFDDYESPKHKWGCINNQGKIVIDPIYDDIKDMQNGIAAANYQGRWGYIDSLGTKLIDFKYKQAYSFTGNQTFVQDFQNNWLLIDQEGLILDSLTYTSYESYHEGHAVVGKQGLKGIINATGKLIVPITYQSIKQGNEGIFVGKKNGFYGLSHISGKSILPHEYQNIYLPVNDDIFRLKKDDHYGFCDKKGQIKNGSFSKAFDFYYDKTIVKSKSGYQLLSKDMSSLRNLPYEKIQYAGEAKWKYKENGRWGLLDSNGEQLTTADYELLNRYSDGMIAASKAKLWGYLDAAGEEVIAFKHPLIWDFHNGLARMIDNRGVGFIDKEGRLVIDDMFIEVRDFYNGTARFQTY